MVQANGIWPIANQLPRVTRDIKKPTQAGGTEAVTRKSKVAEHHVQAAEHHEKAAEHHREAAKHHEAGSDEKAAHHAVVAQGHEVHAEHHAEEAAKQHAEQHGGSVKK